MEAGGYTIRREPTITLQTASPITTVSSRPFAVRAARAAGLVIVAGVGSILLYGLPYYSAPMAARVRHDLHPWLKPSGTIGQSLGLLALSLFLFLWLYPIRKRLGRRPALGSIPRWLDVHIVAGLLVPFVAATHASFRFHGLIGLGYGSMFVVFVSGLVGRYFYVHIPRGKTGVTMTRDEVAAERRQLLHDVAVATGRGVPEIEARLAPETAVRPTLNVLVVLARMVSDDLSRRRAVRALAEDLRQEGGPSLPPARRRDVVRLARREMALAQQVAMLEGAHRVFRWWHAAHQPFAVTALLAVLLHVAVAEAMGQTWFY
jgi:hypothetical protein